MNSDITDLSTTRHNGNKSERTGNTLHIFSGLLNLLADRPRLRRRFRRFIFQHVHIDSKSVSCSRRHNTQRHKTSIRSHGDESEPQDTGSAERWRTQTLLWLRYLSINLIKNSDGNMANVMSRGSPRQTPLFETFRSPCRVCSLVQHHERDALFIWIVFVYRDPGLLYILEGGLKVRFPLTCT